MENLTVEAFGTLWNLSVLSVRFKALSAERFGTLAHGSTILRFYKVPQGAVRVPKVPLRSPRSQLRLWALAEFWPSGWKLVVL